MTAVAAVNCIPVVVNHIIPFAHHTAKINKVKDLALTF